MIQNRKFFLLLSEKKVDRVTHYLTGDKLITADKIIFS